MYSNKNYGKCLVFQFKKNPNLYIKKGFNVQHGLLVNPLALFLGENIGKQKLHLLLTIAIDHILKRALHFLMYLMWSHISSKEGL